MDNLNTIQELENDNAILRDEVNILINLVQDAVYGDFILDEWMEKAKTTLNDLGV